MTQMVAFILGICGALLIWILKSRIERSQVKKFTNHYLTKSVIQQCDDLKKDYQTVIDYITEYKKGHLTLMAFESFNTDNLTATVPQNYYLIYKENFEIYNDIKNMIGYISSDLPFHIKRQYFDLINSHLKEKNKIGDVEHSKTCRYCIDKREIAIKQAEMRMQEVERLKELINSLVKTK